MARATTLIAALLPALASAHFSILYPPTAFITTGSGANQPPCGPGTLPDTQAADHPYLNAGSEIALSTHGSADWSIRYSLDPIPTAGGNWTDMIAPIETEGDGVFCITTAKAQATDQRGWISIKAEMQEGTYYHCAYVNFVDVATLMFPLACKNDTSVKVDFDDGKDDGEDKTSTTKTSTRYTNSTSSTKYHNSTMTQTTQTTTGGSVTSKGTTTVTGSKTKTADDGDDSTTTNQPTDTSPQPTADDGPSTITSTSIVLPTQTSGGGQSGTATSSGSVQVPTGAAVNTKGSPFGMAGFAAVVLGAGILCAGLLA